MYGDLFLLRLAVGVVFIYHSLPKLRDPKVSAAGLGWHMNQAFALGIIEFIGGIGLIGGVGVGLLSLALSAVMIGAIYYKAQKWNVPFASMTATGWEFDLVLLAANLTIYLNY